jgi:hypothetical protein
MAKNSPFFGEKIMINQWTQKLTQGRFGKIWWYNFQYDLSIHNLSKDLELQFFQAIEQQLAASDNEATPLEVLIGVLESPTQLFSLKGRLVSDSKQFSCVITAHAFAHFLINRKAIGVGHSEVLERKIWEMFEQGMIIPEMHFKGAIKSRRNYFWATPAKSLTKALAEPGTSFEAEASGQLQERPVATDVRNLLGLSYMLEGVGLYRIDLPDNLPSDATICVPTTLDSSPSSVFLPTDGHSAFGQTFHLLKLDTGVEEVVISPIEFTGECKVTQIGFVSSPLPDDSAVWLALEERVVHRSSRDPQELTGNQQNPQEW